VRAQRWIVATSVLIVAGACYLHRQSTPSRLFTARNLAVGDLTTAEPTGIPGEKGHDMKSVWLWTDYDTLQKSSRLPIGYDIASHGLAVRLATGSPVRIESVSSAIDAMNVSYMVTVLGGDLSGRSGWLQHTSIRDGIPLRESVRGATMKK
jgi:hypothetical protein